MISDKTLLIIGCIFMALGILTGFVIPTAIVSALPVSGPDPSWCTTTAGASFQQDIEPYRIASIVCFCIGVLVLLLWVLRKTSHEELRSLLEWVEEQEEEMAEVDRYALERVKNKINEMLEADT